ncbi:unnamed protein product, partial [Brachionus calyciflorus]
NGKQWLNGSISPEICNHRNSQKRTNNKFEGFHSKLTKFLPKYHPKFSDMVNCIIKEDAKTRNEYLKLIKKSKKSKREYEKDLQIQLIQEDFERNKVYFKTYFDILTNYLISPYDQELDEDIDDISSKEDDLIDVFEPEENDQIFSNVKILKLKNSYKNVDFTGDIESRIKQLQQHRARQANEKDVTVDDAISKVVCNAKIGLKQETLDTVPVIPNGQIVEVITVDENIQVENVTFLLNQTQWLMGRHIDAAFDEIEKSALIRGYINLAIVNNLKMEDCIRQNRFLHESPELDKIYVVNICWTLGKHMIKLNGCEDWKISSETSYPKQQSNGTDCGVFTCLYAKYLAFGSTFDFSQDDIANFRKIMTT